MLSQYYGFQKDPFGVTPDPQCLYQSPTHREALASLNYGFYANRGFTALIAPPGMGKTTLLHRFLNGIQNDARTAFLFDVQCEPIELLNYMLRDLGIVPASNGIEMREQLKGLLVKEARAGRILVAVVDEAQNLSDAQLEMLRLLTNFETRQAKLMQIVLAGQPALADTLMKPSLEQLRQRVSTICRLTPLTPAETASYVDYRVKEAGYVGAPLFTDDALTLIANASHGTPRSINNLCFNALSLCCALQAKKVNRDMAAEVIGDQQLFPKPAETILQPVVFASTQAGDWDEREKSNGRRHFWLRAAVMILVLSMLAALTFRFWPSLVPKVADLSAVFASAQPPAHLGNSSSNAVTPEYTSQVSPFEVIVEPNQRLQDIAIHHLGKFDNQLLNRILLLNPGLRNLDHVEAGQRLLLPGPPAVPREVKNVAPSASERDTQSLSTSTIAEPKSTDSSFDVIVGPDQTLADIAIKYLGNFDLQRLRQIRALNPKLTDPDHILTGQRLHLPRPSAPVADNTMPIAAARSRP